MDDTVTTPNSSVPKEFNEAVESSNSNAEEASKKQMEKDASLGHRLTLAMHTVGVDVTSKGGSVAKEAQNQITRAATTTVRTVKQGGQQVAKTVVRHFAPTKDGSELADDNPSDSNQPSNLGAHKRTPSSTSSEPPMEGPPMVPDNSTTNNCASGSLERIASSIFFDKSNVVGLDDDRMVFWVVVASVTFVATVQNLGVIAHEKTVPLSVAGAWMLLAFTVGMEVDGAILVETIKYHLLGPNLAAVSDTTTPDSTMVGLTNAISEPISEDIRGRKRNPVRFVSRWLTSRRHKETPPDSSTTRTVLRRTTSYHARVLNSMPFDAIMVLHLSRFGRRKVEHATNQHEGPGTGKMEHKFDDEASKKGEAMGRMDSEKISATVLLSKTNVHPACRLRGLDIFLTDCAESPMSTHPFLLRYVKCCFHHPNYNPFNDSMFFSGTDCEMYLPFLSI